MRVLLTNDDSVTYPGLLAIAKVLEEHASELFILGPRHEQSGISQAITFLRPLMPEKLNNGFNGYSLDGTPADCVKLALKELCPWKPDVVVSGINGGLNAGINICYSGTVGGALAASAFGVRAIALSLEFQKGVPLDFDRAAELSWPLIRRFTAMDLPDKTTVNINFPLAALDGNAETVFVPAATTPHGYGYEVGQDPKDRPFYWATNRPDPEFTPHATDCSELQKGNITVTPLMFDLNNAPALEYMKQLDRKASA